jgi:hypothetical protein
MIRFLTLQVRMGRITIEQVPEAYRAAVQAALEG